MIRLFPDPVLRKPAEPVSHFDEKLRETLKLMIATMRAQPSGIGIAAPQVGISKQIAIVDVSARDPKASQLILINPILWSQKGEKISREGCMSLPDYTGYLKRHETIGLRWQNEKGKWREQVFDGIEAVCIQHELDHLRGILFFDHVTSLKRDMIPRPTKGKKPSSA